MPQIPRSVQGGARRAQTKYRTKVKDRAGLACLPVLVFVQGPRSVA